MQQNWYDVKTAADYLGMTPSGLRKVLDRGELSYFQARPHSPIKIKSEWLGAYIDQHTHRTADKSDTKPTMGNGRPRRATRAVDTGNGNRNGFTLDLFR